VTVSCKGAVTIEKPLMTGWIKLHREIMTDSWEWHGDTNTTFLFISLILLANHKDGFCYGQKVPRGSLLTGLKKLKDKTGISIQSIRTSLNKLKSTSKLTIKTNNKHSVITINNYDLYQDTNKQTNKQLTNNQQTTNKQLTTNKNEKKVKNEKNVKKRESISQKFPNLESIQEQDIQEISEAYQVPGAFVRSKIDDIENYCESTGKSYKNYKATLRNWVKKDAMNIVKEKNEQSQIAFLE
jgi:hypothetical protein